MLRRFLIACFMVRVLVANEDTRAETVRLISLFTLMLFSMLWLFATALVFIFDLPGMVAEALSIGMWASAVVFCAEV